MPLHTCLDKLNVQSWAWHLLWTDSQGGKEDYFSSFQQMWERDHWRTRGHLWNSVCVWLIVSCVLTWCEEALHPPFYTVWGPVSYEINIGRKHGQETLPGPGENQWHGKIRGSPPSLPSWGGGARRLPLTSSQTYMDLALGLSPVQWLEPSLPSARWHLELHLPLCQFLCEKQACRPVSSDKL